MPSCGLCKHDRIARNCKQCRAARRIGGALHPIPAHRLTRQDLERLRDLRPIASSVRGVLDGTLVATVKLEHESNQRWSERCAQEVRDLLSSDTIVEEMANDLEFQKQVHELLSRHISARGLCGRDSMRLAVLQSLLAASRCDATLPPISACCKSM